MCLLRTLWGLMSLTHVEHWLSTWHITGVVSGIVIVIVTVIVTDKVRTRTLDPCAYHKITSRDSTFPSFPWANGFIFSILSSCVSVLPQIPGCCGNGETGEARPKHHLKGPWLHRCTVWLQERLQIELLFLQGGTLQCKGIHVLKAFSWNPGDLPQG